jgi:hypothetical protein
VLQKNTNQWVRLRFLTAIILSFLMGLKSCVSAQSTRTEERTTSFEIEKDSYYNLLIEKIRDKIVARDRLKNPELEVILASIGYPQNSDFLVIQLTFFEDSLYLYQQQRDKRFKEPISARFRKVKSDSLIKVVAGYFGNYKENHIQKYFSRNESRKNDFQNLRSIIIRKGDVYNVVFFAVNGTKYSDENDNLPDVRLLEILRLMERNYGKYFDIPLD